MKNKIKPMIFIGILLIMVGIALTIYFYPTTSTTPTPGQGPILNWICKGPVNDAVNATNKKWDAELKSATNIFSCPPSVDTSKLELTIKDDDVFVDNRDNVNMSFIWTSNLDICPAKIPSIKLKIYYQQYGLLYTFTLNQKGVTTDTLINIADKKRYYRTKINGSAISDGGSKTTIFDLYSGFDRGQLSLIID